MKTDPSPADSAKKAASFMMALCLEVNDRRAEMCLVELLALTAIVPQDATRVWS